jgi:hypothetical protein
MRILGSKRSLRKKGDVITIIPSSCLSLNLSAAIPNPTKRKQMINKTNGKVWEWIR